MSQKKVIVTIERSDDHEDQLQEAVDRRAALNAGTTGIVLTNYDATILAAQNAQTAVSTHAPGSANARNGAFEKMFLEEADLQRQMQKLVDNLAGSIDDKIALALSNGFQIQDFGTINKQDFVVVDGPTSGSAKLVAKGAKEESFHEWYFSKDGGTTWEYIEPSFKANKIVGGYQPADKLRFKHRIWLRKGPSDWHYADFVVR